MNKFAKAFVLLTVACNVGFLYSNKASAADVNGVAYINKILSKKPKVVREKTVKVTKRECEVVHIRVINESYDRCRDYTIDEKLKFKEVAKISKAKVVEVKNIKFDYSKVVELPTEPLLNRIDFLNCADGVTLSNSVTLSVSGTKGHTFTKTRGVSNTVGGSVSMTANYMGFGGSASFNVSQTISTSTSVAESESETESKSQTWTVTVPPKTQAYAEILAYQVAVDVPFSATIILDGTLRSNLSGFRRASDILSEKERTISFEGNLHIDNVSRTFYRTQNLTDVPKCDSQTDKDKLIMTSYDDNIPLDQISNETLLAFSENVEPSIFASLTRGFDLSRKSLYSDQKAVGVLIDTIGAANGISYQVLSTAEIMKPSVQCGFNDLSIPNPAIYNSETRQYSEHLDGVLLRTWVDNVDTFSRCHQV